MSFYYRSYFTKDTTLYSDSEINTGNNRVGEVISLNTECCGAYSRYIFQIDLSHLRQMYNDCVDISKLKHTLKLYPTFSLCDKERTALGSSLYLFPINQEWDEGCGHTVDYNNPCNCTSIYKDNNVISTEGANWYNARCGEKWASEGIYDVCYTECGSGTTFYYLPLSNQIDPPTAITINNQTVETVWVKSEIPQYYYSGITTPNTQEKVGLHDKQEIAQITDDFVYPMCGNLENHVEPTDYTHGISDHTTTGNCISAVYVTANTETTYETKIDENCGLVPKEEVCLSYAVSAVTDFLRYYRVPCDNFCVIEIDMTDIINNILENDLCDYGFGLSFCPDEEMEFDDKAIRFHSRESLSFFKPFLESKNCECEIDDRNNIECDEISSLYLYTNTPLDRCPTVNIFDDENNQLFVTGSTCVSSCVYKADIIISGDTDCSTFYDVWTDIVVNGKNKKDIENEFHLKDEEIENVNFANNNGRTTVSISGIKKNEKIGCDELRKINVHIRNPKKDRCALKIDSVEYRICIDQGFDSHTVVDWCGVNMINCDYYFMLDTSWMLSTTYTLEVRVNSKFESVRQCNELKFTIDSDVKC